MTTKPFSPTKAIDFGAATESHNHTESCSQTVNQTVITSRSRTSAVAANPLVWRAAASARVAVGAKS